MAGLPGINTEYMLGNWFFGKGMTVSLEYLHYRLGGANFAIADDNNSIFNEADTGDNLKFDNIDVVRLGLNVKLGVNKTYLITVQFRR